MMQAMRRGSGRAWLCAAGSAAVALARRAIREEKSPDRTHDERVQDAQNRFDWYTRHLYRPHQHFTYDPASWSRPLMEQSKRQKSLSLLERLHNLQERAAEQAAHAEGITRSDGTTTNDNNNDEALPSYFFDAKDGQDGVDAAASPSLQDLLDKTEWLHHRLHMPRYCGTQSTSLRRRAQYTQEFRHTLVTLYHRVREATVDVTVSHDAMLCVWFTLVQHIADLVTGLMTTQPTESATSPLDHDATTTDEAAVLLRVYDDLERTLLLQRQASVVSDMTHASLEQLIELLYLIAHPFSVRCRQRNKSSLATGTLDECVMRKLCDAVLDKLQTRLMEWQEGEDAGVRQERLDPVHVYALCTSLAHCVHTECGAQIVQQRASLCCRLLRYSAAYLLDLLRASLALPQHDGVPLHPRHGRRASATAALSPKAIAMDAAGRSTGIRQPQTQPGDVVYITQAATAIVRLVLDAAENSATAAARMPRECARCLDSLLRLFAFTPNYDLDATVTIAFCNVLLEYGVVAAWGQEASAQGHSGPAALWHDETVDGATHRALRFMLLLSRLSFHDAVAAEAEQGNMTRLLLHLCALPVPQTVTTASPAWVWEWRRLRGQALRGLFDALTPAMLLASRPAALSTRDTTWQSWEEAVAFGHVTSAVPVELWRVCCETRLGLNDAAAVAGGTGRRCPASLALALLLLRARLAAAAVPRASRHVGVDGWTFLLLAHCMSQAGHGRVLQARLCTTAAAWDEAVAELPVEHRGLVAPLIAEVKQYMDDTAVERHRVRCFHAATL